MEYVGIVLVLALLQYFSYGLRVGGFRQKLKEPAVDAPKDLQLKRAIRVQVNTGEFLIIFIPLLVMCGYFWDPKIAAGIGVLWLVGRALYRIGYMKDGSSRFRGFLIANISVVLLLLGTLYGIGKNLIG